MKPEVKKIRKSSTRVLRVVRDMDLQFFSSVTHVFDMGPNYIRLHIPNKGKCPLPAYNVDVRYDKEKDLFQAQTMKVVALGTIRSIRSPWVAQENVGNAIRRTFADVRRKRFGHNRVAIRVRPRRLLK